MPRVVRKWRGNIHLILVEVQDDLSSLLKRDLAFKAKNPTSGLFTEAERNTLLSALGVLHDTEEETVTR